MKIVGIKDFVYSGITPLFLSSLFSAAVYGMFIGNSSPLKIGIGTVSALLSVLGVLDAKSRYKDFKKIKHFFEQYGVREGYMRNLLGNPCLRGCLIHAGNVTGNGTKVRKFIKENGYTFFHILPDYLIQNPLFFVQKGFWKNAKRFWTSAFFK